jgi:hypothetical protein
MFNSLRMIIEFVTNTTNILIKNMIKKNKKIDNELFGYFL